MKNKNKSLWEKVVWKRVMVFATIMLLVAGALTPVIKKADASDDFDWAWSSGSGGTGDLYRTGNVSIGSSSSPAKLYVHNGPVYFSGTDGSTPASGEGTRLMWIPAKSAFRAGYVFTSQWDNANIGPYSMATGYSTTASNSSATAMGIYTTASGTSSTAMGSGTTASGDRSTAMGHMTTASGPYSTAMGYNTLANNTGSVALGYETTASGDTSTAMGYDTVASNNYATAMGFRTTASGIVSTAIGHWTTASGYCSTAMGDSTIANASYATAMGSYTIASNLYATAMGRTITVSGENSVGIGLNSTSYTVSDNNVMSVMGGDIGIGTTSPSAKLEVENGAVLFEGTTGGTPVSGAGRRMMWIPSKYAFRAGYVDGTQWDDANIGWASVAMGRDTTASGLWGSMAVGYGATASGSFGAMALGAGTTASGTCSIALGSGTTASGDGSTAMGGSTTASGNYSTAMGENTTASGRTSTALGSNITVSGRHSLGIGLSDTPYTVLSDNVMSVMGGNVGIGTVSPDANYSMEIQGNPKGLYVKTDNNTYQSIVGQCHHQYRPAGFVLENRYPASASFPKGVMMRFKGMDTNGVMQEYLAFIAEYVTRTAGAIDGDCWIRPVKNNAANWAFRFTHDGKLLIKDGGSASDVPESALHVVGAINLDPIPAPSAPTTGFIIYCDQADGDLKAKSDTGIVTLIASD